MDRSGQIISFELCRFGMTRSEELLRLAITAGDSTLLPRQLAQHILQNPPVLEVENLLRRVDTHLSLE